MDAGTAAFYDDYANQLEATEASRSAMLGLLAATLQPGASVLDVGTGSGRDVAALRDLGFDAFGVEPNPAMRDTALRLRPGLAGCLADASLPALGRPFSDRYAQGFDAVVCSAVLMHVAPASLAAALTALAHQLRPPRHQEPAHLRPALALSLPEMDAAHLHDDRDADGRRFHNHAPALVEALLGELGLATERADVNDAVLTSTGTRWHMRVFRRRAAL